MSVRRRDLLLTGLSAATATWPQLGWTQTTWSLPEFLAVSARLTGFPVAQLSTSAGAVLLKSFQERGVLPAPSTVSATAPLPPAAPWSQAVVAAWYSGVYETPAGPRVATHDEALMWHSADFMHPPGQCGGGFGYWSEAPLSVAIKPTEAAKS